MGGSSGGFFRSGEKDPFEYGKKLRESEQRSLDKEFEASVGKVINDLLERYNRRDVEATSKHLDLIKTKLDKELDSSVNLIFNGSVAKHTYVDGFSDVDALIVIDKKSFEGKSPKEVREEIGDLIKERLPKTQVKVGSQAITILFNDQKIQVLPATKYYNGYRISDESGNNWSHIKPKEFANKLTKVNSEMAGKLVPTIKLAKSIIGQNESSKINGFHTESLAIDIFKDYNGNKNVKAMIKHFFSMASNKVLDPIKDSKGNSISVDNYLGSSNSLERKIISNSFDRIYRRMNNADGSQNIEYWKKILGSKS
ncbi:CBASS oligonucleotide cyclase [Psychroserpens sp. XS_ASV72]|uniref:CBASS oligonucleotide cyclase n=1 Tax=Psychroserpens sp. XS_ASV72 TaxID=3241293 RepID=UPI00351859D0